VSIPHLAAPQQNTAARWFAHAGWMECQRIAAVYDFTLSWQDDGDTRTLLLLGADSPAEMMMTIHRSQLDTSRLEATTGLILRWMLERGAHWRGFTYDPLKGRD
jgi:hypothetical protein